MPTGIPGDGPGDDQAERDRVALRIEGEDAASLTYSEMAARSAQVANWLRSLRVARGDRVLLMLGNIARGET